MKFLNILVKVKIACLFIILSISVLGQDSLCPPWPPKKQGSVWNPGKNDSLDKKSSKGPTESQVMFSKRVYSYIDFKEKINVTLCNNTDMKLKIYPLYEILTLWIAKGRIRCFRTSEFGSAKNIPLTLTEFKRRGIKNDTVEERTIDEKGNEKIMWQIKTDTLGIDKILGFVIKEDWYFNKRSVMMEKKIIGFAPVVFDIKNHKNKELYWVYYPECCELLSSYLTFNPLGGNLAFTYRNLFEKRSFSSYVLKESNVHERDKPENSRGLEAETENTRNKEKFESGEDDLWSK